MARRRSCESQRTQVHRIDGSFERAFEIEKVELTFGLRPVFFEHAASGDDAERNHFLRQLSWLKNRENPANFEQSHVSSAMIQIVTHRAQETRQQCRPHP